jgi:hypothetical protein
MDVCRLPTRAFPLGIRTSLVPAAEFAPLLRAVHAAGHVAAVATPERLHRGRPTLAAIPPGERSAPVIERAGARFTTHADDRGATLDAFTRQPTDRTLAARLAVAGPPYTEAHIGAAACLARSADLLNAIAGAAPSSAPVAMGAAA